MRACLKTALTMLLVLFLQTDSAYCGNLPEFFGTYIQLENDSSTELMINKNVGATGWFVKQQQPKSNNAKDLQKMFQTGGDLGAALNAASNVKKFITGFSGAIVSTSDLKGFILYGEFDIGDVKLYRLSNRTIPENATFVEYRGPKPIDKSKMWFPSQSVQFRSKPIQEKMYFVKPREQISCGCYAFKIDGNYYDFKVSSSNQNPFVGTYIWTNYMKSSGLFGGTSVNSRGELHVTEVDSDGYAKGEWITLNKDTGEFQSKEPILRVRFDTQNKKYVNKMEDKKEEGHLYGMMEGDIHIDSASECGCMSIEISTKFVPYEHYKDHDFLKKYEIFGEMKKQ